MNSDPTPAFAGRAMIASVLSFLLPALPLVAAVTPDWITQIAGSIKALSESRITITVPSEEDWQKFWGAISSSLGSGSVDDLAGLAPQAETALEYLDNIPSAKPYADWLRQRLDYLEVADEVAQVERRTAAPAPVRPQPPRPSVTQSNRPPASIVPRNAPYAPPVEQQAQIEKAQRMSRFARGSAIWQRRIARRAAPQNASTLVPRLKEIFRSEGVPEQLVWLAEVESTMNPQARSPSGAAGLFQMMPPTAQRFGLRVSPPPDERFDAQRQARAAAQYLRFLNLRYRNWPLALAAYNAGEGRISKALQQTGGKTFEDIAPSLSLETQMYVPKIDAVLHHREGTNIDRLAPARI